MTRAGPFLVAAIALLSAAPAAADDPVRESDLLAPVERPERPLKIEIESGIEFGRMALRGTGNFKPGMVVQTATVILNIVLAPIFIFGWGIGRPMGVAGAALASLVAIVFGVGWLATYFVGKEAFLTFAPHDWRPNHRRDPRLPRCYRA